MGMTLFDGTILNGNTQYVPVPVYGSAIGLQIAWRDGTSNVSSIALQLTSAPASVAPADAAGEDYGWVDSGESITGPAGAAAGAELVNLQNVRQTRARLVIVASADCDMLITDGALGS
jgi:hypothetical protein